MDVNEVIGKEKTKELQDEFGYDRVIFVKQSVDDESFKKVFDATIDKFNQLDIVVNNAAVIDEFDWKKCVDVNLVSEPIQFINCYYLIINSRKAQCREHS